MIRVVVALIRTPGAGRRRTHVEERLGGAILVGPERKPRDHRFERTVEGFEHLRVARQVEHIGAAQREAGVGLR